MRRMDRYQNVEETSSREKNNQDLYQNIGRNSRVANFSDVVNANAYDISSPNKNISTREDYHKYKEYNDVEISKPKKELENFREIYKTDETKSYDINAVLEKARKNRPASEEETRRKLKNENLNILLNGNEEELKKFKEAIKKKVIRPDDPEVRDIIDTIYSKTLAGELDKDTGVMLLSDLMATSIMDRVDNQKEEKENKETTEEVVVEEIHEEIEITEENVEDKEEEKKEEKPEIEDNSIVMKEEDLEKVAELKDKVEEQKPLVKADTDFYTRSMDLSDKDFDMDTEFQENSLPIVIKLIIVLIILAAIAAAGYFIWKRFF